MYPFIPNEIIYIIITFLDPIQACNIICTHPFLYYNLGLFWKPQSYALNLKNYSLCYSVLLYQLHIPHYCLLCHNKIHKEITMILCDCIPQNNNHLYIKYHSHCIKKYRKKKISNIQNIYICPICKHTCIGIKCN